MSAIAALGELETALNMLADPARRDRQARVRATIHLLVIQDLLLTMIDEHATDDTTPTPERLTANREN